MKMSLTAKIIDWPCAHAVNISKEIKRTLQKYVCNLLLNNYMYINRSVETVHHKVEGSMSEAPI